MPSTLAAGWRRCGIQPGDTVLVHCNIVRTLVRERAGTPQTVLDSFLRAVGPDGTLLFPLFNFGFTKGMPFDIRTTPSQMGAVTEAARLHPQAIRTGHPIYSFAVIGALAERFRVDNFSGCGPDSPFAILREVDGKIAILDLTDQNSMTFYHHVEEMHRVDYRYHKTFTSQYTDASGTTTGRTYGLFVRDLGRGVVTDVNAMSELLWDQGLYQGDRPNRGVGLRTISANALYEAVSQVIADGRALGMLYSIERP